MQSKPATLPAKSTLRPNPAQRNHAKEVGQLRGLAWIHNKTQRLAPNSLF
jgi:hypothetical protein